MPTPGFKAQLSINDGGGRFDGLITISLPSLEAGKYDATELDQEASGSPDPYERELPTGLIKVGPVKAEQFYSKANYNRLQALIGQRDKSIVLTTPDDGSNGNTPVKLVATFPGFIQKIDELKFEKNNPIAIPFEFCVQSKPTFA
jgi:hypothetical protein